MDTANRGLDFTKTTLAYYEAWLGESGCLSSGEGVRPRQSDLQKIMQLKQIINVGATCGRLRVTYNSICRCYERGCCTHKQRDAVGGIPYEILHKG